MIYFWYVCLALHSSTVRQFCVDCGNVTISSVVLVVLGMWVRELIYVEYITEIHVPYKDHGLIKPVRCVHENLTDLPWCSGPKCFDSHYWEQKYTMWSNHERPEEREKEIVPLFSVWSDQSVFRLPLNTNSTCLVFWKSRCFPKVKNILII